jgi:hypothetical protein
MVVVLGEVSVVEIFLTDLNILILKEIDYEWEYT